MTKLGARDACQMDETDGCVEITGTTGPMGHNVDDLMQIMKIFLSQDVFERDLIIPPIPFNEDDYNQNPTNLRLGYFDYDGFFYPCKAVRRSIEETVSACKKVGIEMIEIEVPNSKEYTDAMAKFFLGESKRDEIMLQGEPPIIEDDPTQYISMLPSFVRNILASILPHIGMERESIFFRALGDPSIGLYLEACKERRIFERAFNKILDDKELDGFVFPGVSGPAFKHYKSSELSAIILITVIANMIDAPSCVIPVSTVTKDDLAEEYNDPKYPNDQFVKEARKDWQNSEGMPVGIQVCTRTYQEEKCLGIGKIIESALK